MREKEHDDQVRKEELMVQKSDSKHSRMIGTGAFKDSEAKVYKNERRKGHLGVQGSLNVKTLVAEPAHVGMTNDFMDAYKRTHVIIAGRPSCARSATSNAASKEDGIVC